MSNRPSKRTLGSEKVRNASAARAANARTFWIFAGVLVVVAVALIVAIVATRGSGDAQGGGASPSGGTVVPSGDLSYGRVEVQGQPLPALPQGGADPAVGRPIPDVEGQTFDGSPVTITKDGKPKVVLFLAHWCPHCQAEVPRIQRWLDDNGMPADVELRAVATSTDGSRPNGPPGAWLRREGWSVPTLVDDEQFTAAQAFGLSGFPFFVAVDAQGDVVGRASGELSIQAWEQLLAAARTGSGTGGAGGPASGAS